MRHGGPVASPRVQFPCQRVERPRVLPEEGQIEDGLGLGEVERRQVGIEARVRRTEIGDCYLNFSFPVLVDYYCYYYYSFGSRL